jgi:superfamily II DNA or RNA helicase
MWWRLPETDGDVVFASIQSLTGNLAAFDPTTFDYVVVDEFHHADAPTYRLVIAHFRLEFLLGLTATPERTDRADLLALCADNLVFDVGLVKGIERGLLRPAALLRGAFRPRGWRQSQWSGRSATGPAARRR